MAKLCLGRKISLCAVFFLLLTGFNSNAQLNPAMGSSPWKFANPTQYGFAMNDMSFVDNNNGLAVGNNGGLAKTTDGGNTWQYMPFKYITSSNSVSIATFNDVHFVTPTVAYAVGAGGLMIKSTNGGVNWTQISTPLSALGRSINGLFFVNKDTGYIGGEAIITSSTATLDVNAAPKVYFTRNGGTTWDSLASPFRPQQYNTANPPPATLFSAFNTGRINRIFFANDSVGYVCGSNGQAVPAFASILWKIEKGVVKDYSPHRTKFGVSAFTGAAANHVAGTQSYMGLVAVNDSLVLISSNTNGIVVRVKTGKNDSTVNAVPQIYGAYEPGVYELVAQANTNPSIPVNSPLVPGSMWHMKKAPGGKIVMSNGGRVAFSTDNGSNWTVSIPPIPHSWWSLFALDVTPNGRIVTGGSNGILYDSLPGSSAWRTQYNNVRPYTLTASNPFGFSTFFDFASIGFADCNNGMLVGANGTVVKTSDGGKTWINNSHPVLEAAQSTLQNVVYPAANMLFFTVNNTLYNSTDQLSSYNGIFIDPQNTSAAIGTNCFTTIGTTRAFVVGHRSTAVQRTMIFRSLNANVAVPAWDTVKTFPTGTFAPQLRTIRFANQDTGYTCGTRGKVYRTTDGGATWSDVSPDTTVNSNGTNNYTALSVVNGKTLFVGGASKRLFRSIDAGVTWTDLTLAATTPTTLSAAASISIIEMNDATNGYLLASPFLLKTTDGWVTWTYDVTPFNTVALMLYPKISGPIANKKLFVVTGSQAMPFSNSQIGPSFFEYGNPALYTMASTEQTTNASCSNLTAGSITVNATGGIAPYTYSINGGAPQSSNVLTGLTTGNKTLVIRDAACAIITKTVNVGFTDNLTLTTTPLTDTAVCAGAPVPMLATANLAGTSFAWTPTSGLSASNVANPTAAVNTNSTYTVTATLNGCVRTRPVAISIKANPIISAGPDKTIVVGDKVMLEGSAGNPVSISWTPNTTLTAANTLSPIAAPVVTTPYTLTVVNNQGCTSTDVAVVNVIPYCIKIMNAFTPNGDGINDKWLVTDGNACTKQIMVAVYNRYGGLVYKNDNYNNDWNGTYNGKPVADGTYYYTITYKTITDSRISMKGDVTILR